MRFLLFFVMFCFCFVLWCCILFKRLHWSFRCVKNNGRLSYIKVQHRTIYNAVQRHFKTRMRYHHWTVDICRYNFHSPSLSLSLSLLHSLLMWLLVIDMCHNLHFFHYIGTFPCSIWNFQNLERLSTMKFFADLWPATLGNSNNLHKSKMAAMNE